MNKRIGVSMHVLLVIGIVPFSLLFVALGLSALILLVSAVINFPLFVLGIMGLTLLSQVVPKSNSKPVIHLEVT